MMNMLRACGDWRVIATLAALGAGVAAFAPNLIGAAIPFLLVAACPLSMLLMMRTMGGQQAPPSPDVPVSTPPATAPGVTKPRNADAA